LDHALVSAIISVESAFKPRAVSSKGALGLMQIVPESGGRDAAARCGLRWPLPRETYFDPETNIMLGCAYLHLLLHDWFAEVRDKDTRHYLAISAYNAGVGNVAYKVASTRKLRGLVQLANRNTGPQMYRRLRADLSGIETGEYLEDVVAILEGS
jgi:membrane-bound lytic murein transglycosylase C